MKNLICFSIMLVFFNMFATAENNNIFKCETVGFEIKKPDSWYFITAAQNVDNIKRIQLENEEFHNMMIKYSNAPLVAFSKFKEPFDDLNPSLKVNIKPFGQLKGYTPKEILILLSNQFEFMFSDYSIEQAPKCTVISGIESGYMRVNYSLNNDEGRVFATTSEMWIIPRGDYFFLVGAGTRQDEKTGTRIEIHKIIETIVIYKGGYL